MSVPPKPLLLPRTPIRSYPWLLKAPSTSSLALVPVLPDTIVLVIVAVPLKTILEPRRFESERMLDLARKLRG